MVLMQNDLWSLKMDGHLWEWITRDIHSRIASWPLVSPKRFTRTTQPHFSSCYGAAFVIIEIPSWWWCCWSYYKWNLQGCNHRSERRRALFGKNGKVLQALQHDCEAGRWEDSTKRCVPQVLGRHQWLSSRRIDFLETTLAWNTWCQTSLDSDTCLYPALGPRCFWSIIVFSEWHLACCAPGLGSFLGVFSDTTTVGSVASSQLRWEVGVSH